MRMHPPMSPPQRWSEDEEHAGSSDVVSSPVSSPLCTHHKTFSQGSTSPDSVAIDELSQEAADERECGYISPIPSAYSDCIFEAFGSDVDLYRDVFRVQPSVKERELRIAYFRRGREALSESNPGALEEISTMSASTKTTFQAVSMAYEILSRPDCKEHYDNYGWVGVYRQETMASNERDVMPMCPSSILRASTSSVDQQTHKISRRKIRWSEHVEELVYTLDDEELSFKLGSRASQRESSGSSSSKHGTTQAKTKIWLEATQIAAELDKMDDASEPSLVSDFLDDIEKGLDGLEASVDSFMKFAWSGGLDRRNESGSTALGSGATSNSTSVVPGEGVSGDGLTQQQRGQQKQPVDQFSNDITDCESRDAALDSMDVEFTPLHEEVTLSPRLVDDEQTISPTDVLHTLVGDAKASSLEGSDPLSNLFASLMKPAPDVALSYIADAIDPESAVKRLFREFDDENAMMADILNVTCDSDHLFSSFSVVSPDSTVPKCSKDDFEKTFTADPWKCSVDTDVDGACVPMTLMETRDESKSSLKIARKLSASSRASLDKTPIVTLPAVDTQDPVDHSDPGFNPFGDEPPMSRKAAAGIAVNPQNFVIDHRCQTRSLFAEDCAASVSTISASDIGSYYSAADKLHHKKQVRGTNEDIKGCSVVDEEINACVSTSGRPNDAYRALNEFQLRPVDEATWSQALHESTHTDPFFTNASDILHLRETASHVSSLTGKPSVVSASARLPACPALFSIPSVGISLPVNKKDPVALAEEANAGDEDFAARLISFVTSVSQEMSRLGESLSSMFSAPDSSIDAMLNRVKQKDSPN